MGSKWGIHKAESGHIIKILIWIIYGFGHAPETSKSKSIHFYAAAHKMSQTSNMSLICFLYTEINRNSIKAKLDPEKKISQRRLWVYDPIRVDVYQVLKWLIRRPIVSGILGLPSQRHLDRRENALMHTRMTYLYKIPNCPHAAKSAVTDN